MVRSNATVRDGRIHEYQVNLQAAFVVDGNGSAADQRERRQSVGAWLANARTRSISRWRSSVPKVPTSS